MKKWFLRIFAIAALTVGIAYAGERLPVSVEHGTGYYLLYDSGGNYLGGFGSANPAVRGAFGTTGHVVPENAFFFRTDLGFPITHTSGSWDTDARPISADAFTAATSFTVGGSSPTAITNIRVYSSSITPVATAAAIGTTAQTFTVTGLTTADKVVVNVPGITALCPVVAARVSAADTLQLWFATMTAAACTPAAGAHIIVAIRS